MGLNILDLCIGYNSLPNAAGDFKESVEEEGRRVQVEQSEFHGESASSVRPMGKRIWSWLVLCEDGNLSQNV